MGVGRRQMREDGKPNRARREVAAGELQRTDKVNVKRNTISPKKAGDWEINA